VLAYEYEPLAGSNILLLPLPEPVTTGRASTVVAARPFLATKAVERTAMFAPDGRWLAYESNETGRLEVYVRSFLLMMPLIESESSITEVHLVLNFLDELRRRFR
jgi:hypothetical protein